MSALCGREALVEKLADGALDGAAKKEAEAHLATCESCRSHLAFLTAVAESARGALAEPPPSYWEHLPRKILERLDAEEAPSTGRGFWRRLLAPDALRWEALLATLLVVVVVGGTVLREHLLAPPSEPMSSAASADAELRAAPAEAVPEGPEAVAPAPVASEPAPFEPNVPSMARDEALREEEAVRSNALSPQTQEELQSLGYVSGGAPSPAAPTPAAMPPSETREQTEAEPERAKTTLQRPSATSRARAFTARSDLSATDTDCDLLREKLAAAPESTADEWYGLARCSVQRYDANPRPELRERAVEDARAFLERESEGTRAEEIRRVLERLQSAAPR